MPEDERLAVERRLREFDRLGEGLRSSSAILLARALADEGAKRLMTIPGVDTVALAILAGRVSDPSDRFERFRCESPRLCQGILTDRELQGVPDCNEKIQLALCGLNSGDVDMEGADRADAQTSVSRVFAINLHDA